MIFSSIFALIFTITGIILSYIFDIPTGSTIVLISSIFYLLTAFRLR
jgi:ABC-type Mn2+/Zn2+ transport system permease subunit